MGKSIKIVPILANEAMAKDVFRLCFSAPEWAQAAHAGQFITIQIPSTGQVFWRRPFSVHQVDRERGIVEILYAVVGRGTEALSTLRPGQSLNVIGLLGNTFSWSADLQHAIIVAGGLGIAPFLLLLQELATMGCKITLFYGARSATYLCRVAELQSLATEVLIMTEDGSFGEKGLVTEAVEAYLETTAQEPGRMLFACGPTAMLQRLQQMVASHPLPAQVTVENIMACGFGACVGCAVTLARPRDDGSRFVLACKEGPVFPLQEIIFDA